MKRQIDAEYGSARVSLLEFVRKTKSNMKFGWFHEVLCARLDQFLKDIIAGKQPRLIIIAPPRHGKSEMASRRFVAYALGRMPTLNIIACSYASDLAARTNRDVQRIIDDPVYGKIFPDTKLNTTNIATLSGKPLRNSSIFEIVGHLGSYRSAGVGQGITGMGFDIGIIDDPIKDAAQAASETERKKIWEWYETTFYSRASPNSGILMITTRWHEDDPAGRMIAAQKAGGDQWEILRLPAIAEEDEQHRKAGEALHPARYPVERLNAIRSVSGSYAFAALYQGAPSPKGGGIVKREDFRFYSRSELETLLQGQYFPFSLVALSVDAAFKDTQDSSYVVVQAWGKRGTKNWLLGQIRERLTFTGTLKAIEAMKSRWPMASAVLIEDKANGPAIIEVLKRKIPGIIAIEPTGSKPARAEAAAPLIEAGNVITPDPNEEPWVEQFIHEWLAVPAGTYWDQVDAADQYLNKYGRSVVVENLDRDSEVSSSLVMTGESAPWNMYATS